MPDKRSQLFAGPRMIICHCQSISSADIHRAIDWMRASDTDVVITPGRVYRALGKAAECGGCMPLFLATMHANPNTKVPAELRNLRANAVKGNDG